MLHLLPLELAEKILFYLSVTDIYNFFLAFGKNYISLSENFWRKRCLEEDFLRVNDHLEWHECFEIGIKKRLGYFVHHFDLPKATPVHVYAKSVIVRDIGIFNVFSLNIESNFTLVQCIPQQNVCYLKDKFFVLQFVEEIHIYRYSLGSGRFDVYRKFSKTLEGNVFGVSKKYCGTHLNRLLKLYSLCDGGEDITLAIPEDVKSLVTRVLQEDKIVISAISFLHEYRVKIYDIPNLEWVLDVKCFNSTGLTNGPNLYIGDHLVGCCEPTFRTRGVYYGPFRVWNHHGKLIIEADIQSSNHNYLRCLYKNQHVLLTTSDSCIKVFNSSGCHESSILTKTIFQDAKVSSAYLLFVLMKGLPLVEVYNWKASCLLHSLSLTSVYHSSILNDFLYCVYDRDRYEVFQLC